MIKRDQPSGDNGDAPARESPFAEPVILPLKESIDLHTFRPGEIPSVVEEFLEQCCQAGFHVVRIIHGKGMGTQRRIIRSLLEKHPQVEAIQDAPPEAGGWGATRVVLKKKG